MEEFYYRYRDVPMSTGYTYFDASGDPHRVVGRVTGALVWLEQYPVLRHTPKGVWIQIDMGEKFICDNWQRKWADPTIEQAAQSYKARKQSQVWRLKNQLCVAEDALEQCDKGSLPTTTNCDTLELENGLR